ncbi:glycosyltransferase [Streptomyces sp. CRN 30]|uniref:glycosyltransferase n=1 Tax=Streptomyces sp. CRN 30 TaxID=3075613 RepID=UPI002A823F18|nr:glycosyltransferase [Streptomyces sp. CRN 30]
MSTSADTAPVITVVVPAYNAAGTVGRALDSLAVQTFRDLEVVVVDDASQDATRAVAERYAERLPGLRVISRDTNSGGVGAPRNDGIRAARGEYVMFLDADDELTAKACEKLLQSARESGADIVAGRTHRVNHERATSRLWQPALYGTERYVAAASAWPELVNDPIAAAKLYRRAFLVEHDILFPEGLFYEDTLFSAMTYAHAEGVAVVAEPVYRWIWEDAAPGAGSITNRRNEIRSIRDRIEVHRRTDAFLESVGARELKAHKDARFLGHDVRLYMKELRTADEEFRSAFLDIVSGYLAEVGEEAYALCSPLDRVRAFYLRHRLPDEALTVSDFEQRRSVVSTDLAQRDGRTYWSGRHLSLPGAAEALDVTELGLHDEPFDNARLFNRVTSLRFDGGTLHVTGEITNQFQRIGAGDRTELVLHVRAKGVPGRASVKAGDVRVTEDHLSYAVSADLGSLAARYADQETVNVSLQVLWEGRKHTTALCVRSLDLEPVDRALDGSGLEASESSSGNLVLRPAGTRTAAVRDVPETDWTWWEGRTRPDVLPAPAEPELSVVLTCAAETESLRASLHSLACQDLFPRTELHLAVGDGAGEDVALAEEFAGKYGNVTVLRAGADAGDGTGIRPSAPYVAFLDGSTVLAEGGLRRLLDAATRNDADVALGNTWQMSGALAAVEERWREHFGAGDTVLDGVGAAPGLLFAAFPGGKVFRSAFLSGLGVRPGPDTGIREVVTALVRARRIALTDSVVQGVPGPGPATGDRLSAMHRMLELNSALADDFASADEADKALVRAFAAGSFDSCLRDLPRILGREELAEIYPRIRELYRDIPDDVVLEHAPAGKSLLLHHAVRSGNAELFRSSTEPPQFLPQLFVDGPLLLRRVAGDVEPSTLLRVENRSALAESVQPVDGALRVEGFLLLGGVDLAQDLENRLELVLTSPSGQERCVAVRQVYRRDRWHVRRQRDLHSGWRADLYHGDLGSLPSGACGLAVRIHGESGHIDIPVTPRPALHRYKAPNRVSGFRYRVTVAGDGTVDLRVAAGRKARIADAARRFADQTAAVLKRRPGWRLRLLYWLTRPVLARRDIWIVGERQDTAQDNGYHFFRYMRENHPERDVHYVIAPNSADREKVAGFGNVIALGSWKHKLYLLNAARLISPYDLEAYLAPPGIAKVEYLRRFGDLMRYRRVFLQHGVTYNDVSQSAHKQSTSVDLFVAASQHEADYIASEMGYDRGEAKALGFPRFDKLQPVEPEQPTILLMPTWRRDIVVPSYNRSRRPKVQFAASEYYRFFSLLLEDERLRNALRESGVRLEFFPHYEIRPYLRHFKVDHPSISVADPKKRGVQEAMKECSLLVTDYSSVFFDVAYMGKPVVYVPFDEDDFYGRHYRRGYYNLSEDGFGPVCRTVDDAVDEIIAAIDRKFTVESPYSDRVDEFFVRRDMANSARVFEAIDRLG